jgi:hypothetical protein
MHFAKDIQHNFDMIHRLNIYRAATRPEWLIAELVNA